MNWAYSGGCLSWPVFNSWHAPGGAHVEYFREGDPFTEGIRTHGHIQNAREQIAAQLAANPDRRAGNIDLHYGDEEQFSCEDRKDLHWATLDSILTLGTTGMPLEQAFLGSYDLRWEVVGEQDGSPVIEFNLTNASTLSSISPDPDKVNAERYGNDPAGTGQDALPGELYTMQSVRWRETFPGGSAPGQPGTWHPMVIVPSIANPVPIEPRPSIVLEPLYQAVRSALPF